MNLNIHRPILNIIGIIVFLLIILLISYVTIIFVVISKFSLSDGQKLSDKQMIDYFEEHKEDFETLNTYLLELQNKGLYRVDDNWTDPNDPSTIGISDQEISDLRKKLYALNIPRGVIMRGSIEYLTYTFGLSVSGGAKGYFYSDEVPTNYFKCDKGKYPLTPFDIESKPEKIETKCSYTIYTRINDKWYIFEDYED